MKVIILGANGKLGLILTKKALERGHEVTAFVRGSMPIKSPKLRIVQGDIYKPETIAPAFGGHDAVLSALGRRGHNAPLICSDGIKAILPAMKKHDVKRLIVISAFGAREHHNFSLYTRLLWLGIPKHMKDKDLMEESIRSSGTDWTMIRPAAYFDNWPKKDYEIFESLRGLYPVVTRQAIAECMLDSLDENDHVHEAVAVRAK